ncbi:hypothetical protein ABH974_002930 [Bradyrhizobium ottawaense]
MIVTHTVLTLVLLAPSLGGLRRAISRGARFGRRTA